MPVRFAPVGNLDVATDPASLPGSVEGKSEFSGAMTRCKNLDLSRAGMARTRRGSIIVSTVAVPGATRIHTHGGYRYTFTQTAIYRDEVAIETGLAGANWEAVPSNAYNVTTESLFATNGPNRVRITGATVELWGLAAPAKPTAVNVDHVYTYDWEFTSGHTVTPSWQLTQDEDDYECLYDWEVDQVGGTATASDSQAVRCCYPFEEPGYTKGARGYKITYARKSGVILECESNPSPAVWTEKGGLTWSAPSDSQVTHVRIYRTLAGGAAFYYAGEVAVGTNGGVARVTDDALGTEAPDDHDRPPTGITSLAGPDFNGVLFGLVGNKLYWSLAKQPEYWPALNYVEIGPPQYPGKAVVLWNGVVYVLTRHRVIQVMGSGGDSFFPIPLASMAGAVSSRAIVAQEKGGLWHAEDGIYQTSGADSRRISDTGFYPTWRGETVEGLPGVEDLDDTLLEIYDNKLWVLYDGQTVLVTDLTTGRTAHYDYGRSFVDWTVSATSTELWALDTSGNVWQLDVGTDDDGTAIEWEIQSKEYSDSLRRYFPRYARWDAEIPDGSTATGEIILEGTVVQTHTLTSREPQKRHVATCNGKRLQVRVTGSGPATVRHAEVE